MQFLEKFKGVGTKPNYEIWENNLVRKINLITLIGFFNVTISFFLFPALNIHSFQNVMLLGIITTPIIIFLNSTRGYLYGAYGFYIIGMIMMTVIAIQLGSESYFINFYFPMTLSVIHLFGRKETLSHIFVILFLFLVSTIIVVYYYSNDLYVLKIEKDNLFKVKIFNIILSLFSGIMEIIIITTESIKHEKTITKMLKEKDVLVAEVFHRVKNNMNIVTSLLNLKKENSNSEEVKNAIEECRNRVFSMALVHQKVFTKNNSSVLNFSTYIKDLVGEITSSMGNKDFSEININTEEIELPLNYAIPCGLILNELITNANKHAKIPSQKLIIAVSLFSENGKRKLIVTDNGPGIQDIKTNFDSLGMELIDSLCQQIDGKYSFENKKGLHFTLEF
ncbi:MAG: sensor histidine kinase [Bacteroidota bacterium]